MTTHLHTLGLLAGTLCCAALTACSDDVTQTLPGTDGLTSAYVLATAVTDGDKRPTCSSPRPSSQAARCRLWATV